MEHEKTVARVVVCAWILSWLVLEMKGFPLGFILFIFENRTIPILPVSRASACIEYVHQSSPSYRSRSFLAHVILCVKLEHFTHMEI
jgi:hypothetical protein